MRLPDETIVFVVDEDAGPHVARGITDAGGRVVMVVEKAGSGAKDRHWIPLACTWGSAIVTRDLNMRRTPEENRALLSSGCHSFILCAGNLKFDELHALAKDNYGSSANVWHARRRSIVMKTVYSSFPQIRRILSLR